MGELLEVMTEKGESTGILISRSEVHSTGAWHKTVQVWIINEKDEVLLQKRHHNKEGCPGKWDVSAGGHCVNAELSLDSARREIKEELGLDFEVNQMSFLGKGTYISNQNLNREWIDVYLVRYNYDLNEIKFQKDEIEELKSVHVKKLKELYDKKDQTLAERDLAFNKLFRRIGLSKIEEREALNFIGKDVRVKIDRPLGSNHPKYGNIYPINYGYISNTESGDDAELDAYIIGVFEPLEEFSGKCIAVIHRINDVEDKLVVVPVDKMYTDEQIEALLEFQERYFAHEILR